MRSYGRLVFIQRFMIGLKTGNNAEVGLTVWAVVLGLASKDSPIGICSVPTVVAPQGWTIPSLGAVSKLFHWQATDYG